MRYTKGLREARERALLTQSELAIRSGVTVSTISRVETSAQAARISTLRKLATALGVAAETLIDWERPGPETGKAAAWMDHADGSSAEASRPDKSREETR